MNDIKSFIETPDFHSIKLVTNEPIRYNKCINKCSHDIKPINCLSTQY